MRALRVALCLLVACGALPADDVRAQPFHEVHGVAADDVLNVRRAPSPQAEIVGALGPRAGGIAVMQRDGDWAQVRLPGDRGLGWVHARFLRPATASFALPRKLVCFGTEPFWSLALDGATATFQPMGEQPEKSRLARTQTSRNSIATTAIGFGPGARERAIVTLTRTCSDGMSDTIHDRDVTVLRRDGSVLTGCCRAP